MIVRNLKGYFQTLVAGALFVTAGYAAATTITQTQSQATVLYSGNDGTIEYDWTLPAVSTANSMGTLHMKAHLNGTSAADLVFTPMLTPMGKPLVFQGAQWASGSAGPFWNLSYSVEGKGLLHLSMQFSLNGKLLTTTVTAAQPWVCGLDIGAWPFTANSRVIPVPYYAGTPPVYLQSFGLFGSAMYDWHGSNASSFDTSGRQAIYSPLTNGTFNTLSEKVVIGVSTNLPDLFPDIGNPPSPHMSAVAGKTVIDIWAGSFDDVTSGLRRLGSYGVNKCAVILHNWQSLGYDNALPQHYPANPSLGGDRALINFVQTGQGLGCSVALHENYVDYYPDYSSFTSSAVALASNLSLMPAWFNSTTQLQAYATKPTWFVANANQQSPQIKSRYNTNSSFIDVNSSVPPWWRTDMDAGSKGAGQFATFVNATKDLWSYERSVYQGPVFGEGGNHSYWTGLLDGAEAQFGSGGVPTNLGANAPLFLDFNLTKVHPYQVNHGMGYYERWVTPGDDISRTDLRDAYRMQEVVYGHAPFIGGQSWSDPAKVLVEQNLVGPVAQRYGTQTVSSIQYQFKGNWTDINTASKAGAWNRVQVRYSNGDTIVANGMQQPMTWQGLTLPAYGWMATGTNLLAYSALKNGILVDYAETATSIFANARNQSDLTVSMAFAIPSLASLTQQNPTTLTFGIQWQLLDYAPLADMVNYVHFVTPAVGSGPNIAFQCDHSFTSSFIGMWKPGVSLLDSFSCSLPSNLPDGAYSMRTGLYSPISWARTATAGVVDDGMRTIIGTLLVNNGGKNISFVPQGSATIQPDQRLNSAGTVVDFDTIRTDGMVSAVHGTNGWTLRAYPLHRNVVVQVKATRVPVPAVGALVCDSPRSPIQITQPVAGYWQIQMNGATSCRW